MHKLIIEDIPSADTLIASELTSKEDLLSLTQGKLRRESCAWHNIVRKNLGDVSILKDENGAPFVSKSDIFISVTHSKDKVAVLFSDTQCGVDIEHTNRNFKNASPKYILPEEEHLLTSDNALCIIWCTKEAFFKYMGMNNILMMSDICVEEINYMENKITAACKGQKKEFTFEKNGDYLVVYTAD